MIVSSNSNCRFYRGDCRELIPTIKTNYDLILTSPPYGMGLHYEGSEDWRPDWKFWHLLHQTSTPNAKLVIHINSSLLDWWIEEAKAAGWNYYHCFAYINPDRATRDYDNFPYHWEPVLFFGKKTTRPRINKETLIENTDIISIKSPQNMLLKPTTHPCPADFFSYLRITSMIDFEVLLDPFAGIGTSLCCAKVKGKQAIGIELSETYMTEAVSNYEKINFTLRDFFC